MVFHSVPEFSKNRRRKLHMLHKRMGENQRVLGEVDERIEQMVGV